MTKRVVLKTLVALILSFPPPTLAFNTKDATITTEGGQCATCSVDTEDGLRLKNSIPFMARTMDIIKEKFKWGDTCENFSDGDSLGKWGNSIRKDYESHSPDLEYLDKGASDIHNLCPTFAQMKPTDKANFWVLVLSAMANYESTCGENGKPHRGPYGTLIGLLQLDRGNEKSYAPNGCRNGDGEAPETTFRCAMYMINGQIRKYDKLFSSESYWDVLRLPRSKAKKIAKAIADYTPCHDETKLNVWDSQVEMNNDILKALQKSATPAYNAFDM